MGLVEIFWDSISLRGVIAFLLLAQVITSYLQRRHEHARLRAIGPRAPTVPSRLPWALDIIYGVVQATIHHQNLEKWRAFFHNSGTDTAARGNDDDRGSSGSGLGSGSYTAELRAVGRRTIFTADPDNIKALLATQFADFGKGAIFHQEWAPFLGDSIFTTDGAQWHTSRQLLRPQFIRDRISDLHCFEAHLETLFKAMANGGPLKGEDQVVDRDAVNGRVFDISDLFFRYTLDVATDFLLGKDVKSLRYVTCAIPIKSESRALIIASELTL